MTIYEGKEKSGGLGMKATFSKYTLLGGFDFRIR